MSTEDQQPAGRRRAADLRTTEAEEQVAFFEDSSHVAPIGNVVAGLVALSLLWAHVPAIPLLTWFAVVVGLATLQAIAALHPEEAADDLHGPGRIIDTNVLAGVVWGVLPWLDVGAFGENELYRWICLALAFAIGAGAMGGLSILTGIAMRVHTPMYLLVAAAFFVAGSPAVGAGVLVYLALMSSDLRATGAHLRQLVATSVETAGIAADAVSEAHHDSVTGLLNRTGALDRIESLRGREPLIAMFIDLDYFKDVNDRLGHDAGDHVLLTTAERIQRVMRPDDIVARLGGDEFLVVLPKGTTDADLITTKMLASIERPIPVGDDEARISASIGVANVTGPGWTTSDLLQRADHALYEAKRSGRRRMVRFDDRLAVELEQRAAREGELRAAIATNGIGVLAQPVVDLATDDFASLELTPHWTAPDGEDLSTAALGELAEHIGLGDALFRCLLLRAVAARVRWREHPEWASTPAAVRVSARQLTRGDILRDLRAIVTARGLEPGEFQLVLTDTAELGDDRALTDVVAEVRSMGVAVVLGEFGGGKSTLGDLMRLPIEIVTIHPALVTRAAADERVAALLAGLDHVARTLGLTVAVEGVRTPEQRDLVRGLGLPYGMGPALCPGRPLDEILERHAVSA